MNKSLLIYKNSKIIIQISEFGLGLDYWECEQSICQVRFCQLFLFGTNDISKIFTTDILTICFAILLKKIIY